MVVIMNWGNNGKPASWRQDLHAFDLVLGGWGAAGATSGNVIEFVHASSDEHLFISTPTAAQKHYAYVANCNRPRGHPNPSLAAQQLAAFILGKCGGAGSGARVIHVDCVGRPTAMSM